MNKKAQVWIETVTYTLVAFILIGLVLSFAKPKIEEFQDEAIIKQSINMLKEIDYIINEVYDSGAGNKRKLELSIKKGDLEINSLADSIVFTLEGRFMYSEPGQEYKEGSLNILTTELGTNYEIRIEKVYNNLNITYFDKEENKTLGKSSTPHILFISNKGGTNQQIDFEIG